MEVYADVFTSELSAFTIKRLAGLRALARHILHRRRLRKLGELRFKRELISFPKSGRTWLRYALHLLGVEETIRFHHDGFEYSDPTRPALDFDLRGTTKANPLR